MNMIASCKRGDDLLAEYITLTECSYMVQARKETPDHVSVQEECLNSSCPKEFSLVGINSAIQKPKEAT